MAFTRLWTPVIDLRFPDDQEAYVTDGVQPTYSPAAHTGAYCFSYITGSNPVGKSFSSTTDIRAGFFWMLTGPFAIGDEALFLLWETPDGTDNYVRYIESTNLLELVVNGVTVDTVDVTTSGVDVEDVWRQIGFTLHCNATTGWVSFYFNDSKILEWSGNTSTGVTALYFGGNLLGEGGWPNSANFDDIYLDDATGEADASPPEKRFMFTNANGAGLNTNWTGSSGLANYTHVDDATADGDATYNFASSALRDDYAVDNVSVLPGYSIAAVIPWTVARKTDGLVATTLQVYTYDGSTYQNSASKSLDTVYSKLDDRHPLQPDGTAWNETDFNAIYVGVEATGDFA